MKYILNFIGNVVVDIICIFRWVVFSIFPQILIPLWNLKFERYTADSLINFDEGSGLGFWGYMKFKWKYYFRKKITIIVDEEYWDIGEVVTNYEGEIVRVYSRYCIGFFEGSEDDTEGMYKYKVFLIK